MKNNCCCKLAFGEEVSRTSSDALRRGVRGHIYYVNAWTSFVYPASIFGQGRKQRSLCGLSNGLQNAQYPTPKRLQAPLPRNFELKIAQNQQEIKWVFFNVYTYKKLTSLYSHSIQCLDSRTSSVSRLLVQLADCTEAIALTL